MMSYEEFCGECKRIFAMNPEISAPDEEQTAKLYRLSVAKYIPENARIIDIGCGAGFPSLPLAICRPDIRIVALDSTAKRINYVQNTANALGLTNLSAIAARAEDKAKDSLYRESFDVAVARAVADLPVLCELCLPFVKVGGHFASMKAARGDEELDNARRAIKTCGGGVAQMIHADLTGDGSNYEKRRLIIIEKVEKTPKNYPRNFAQISKKPL